MFEFQYIELMNWAFWPAMKLPIDQKTIMITGPNGSGKTTFLDAMRTLLRVPRLSSNRRFTDYLNNNVEIAAIKAVVGNTVNGSRKRAFETLGLDSEVVTLAVILKNKSGRWERRFAVLPGDCSMEHLRKLKISELVQPNNYSRIMHEAGCSDSLLRVLALEQGQTDKLCEKSPRDLLELLLDVHGDKEIINRYKQARDNYRQARVQFNQIGVRLAQEEAKLMISQQRADEYKRYHQLRTELQDYENKLIPQSEYKAAQENIQIANLSIDDLKHRLSPLEREILRVQNEVDNGELEIQRRKDAIVRAREQKYQLEKEERDLDINLNRFLDERRVLEKLMAANKETQLKPLEPLKAELDKLRREVLRMELQLEEENKKVREISALANIEAAEKPRKIYPDFVAQFIDTLSDQGITHELLCDVIEIVDKQWQLAIESILGRDRFTFLVEERDQLRARKLGERLRYRGYIVGYEKSTASAKKHKDVKSVANPAINAVSFTESGVPTWIIQNLSRTALVETVEDGISLGKGITSVTKNGYKQDSRGGISIAVDRFYCGSLGQSTQKQYLQQQIQTLQNSIRQVSANIESARHREQHLSNEIAQQELLREGHSAAQRIDQLDLLIIEENRKHKVALEVKRQAEVKLMETLDDLNRFERNFEEQQRWLAAKREDQFDYLNDIKDYQDNINKMNEQLAALHASLPAELISAAALRDVPNIDELTPKYYGIKNLLDSYQTIPDETTVHVYQQHKSEFEKQQQLFLDYQSGLKNWEGEFHQARDKYVSVVEYTIRAYRQNIASLATLAGVTADVILPNLKETVDSLEEAELRVRFGFDGKRPIDISGSTLSGGQRVVVSLILLMAMTTSGGGNRGGFFIIDEPFAHLSIERIDDVSQFLEKSQCQFILTSPTTHNVNIFNAARLQINFRIKKPDQPFAPLPTIIRR